MGHRAVLSAVFTIGVMAPCAQAASPQINYRLRCAGCHGVDASGAATAKIPSLRAGLGHFLRLPEGRAYLIQVPGVSQSPLSNADTAVLMNWILATFSGSEMPEGCAPYTEQEIAQLRSVRLDDVAERRSQIVERLRQMGWTVR